MVNSLRVAAAPIAVGGTSDPRPEVARYLASQRAYTPVPNALISAMIPEVLRDFDSEAEPWFGRFASLADVAEQYRRTELGSSAFNQRRRVVYGLLLETAADQLGRPMYRVGERFFPEPVPNSEPVPRAAIDQRLLAFVRERLARRTRG